MKKRLLITSIVMMLVVAVALSTATYAWFTSNATVTANTVTMTAATSDLASISVGWLGNETKSGTISAVAGDNLQPMCPTTNLTGTTVATAAWAGASIGLNGNFDAAGTTRTPYTWTAPSATYNSVQAFYINNDSTTQPLNISVSAPTIAFTGDDIEALPAGTLLQSGQIYYKKDGENWIRLTAGESADYENGTYVADVTTATAADGAYGLVYSTKGVEDYIRIAIFATSEVGSTAVKPTEIVAANYTYKGLLAKSTSDNVAYGAITSGMAPSALTDQAVGHDVLNATASVTVATNLAPLARVYVIVKVWIDGTYFTAHESGQAANVGLLFSATNYSA